jgi:glutathione S-transferase
MAVARPEHVWVYGGDHSPWVQSVLLGLHARGIRHTLISVPPLAVFRSSGILMPAARTDDGPWLLDSGRILGELGFSKVEATDGEQLRIVFGSCFQRGASSWEFWYRWSYMRDEHPRLVRRLWNHVWRTFPVFYFYTLLKLGRRTRPDKTREELGRDFSYWERRLAHAGPFLGGNEPDTLDLQLFGLVQMFGSIPGASLGVLREDPALPRLREWIETMQRRFSSYRHLYTGPYFEPRLAAIERSPLYERPSYWVGAALMWLALPLTLFTVFYFFRRVRRRGLQSP